MKIKKSSVRKLASHDVTKYILVALCFLACFIYVSYCYTISHSSLTLVFGSIVILLDIMLYVVIDLLYNRGLLSIDKAFIIVLSFLGLLFCFVFTPGIVPDEGYHFLATYRYSNMMLFQFAGAPGITMRSEDTILLDTFLTHNLEHQSYLDILDSNFLAGDASLLFVDNGMDYDFVNNPPQLKLAAAIGLTLGRLLGLGAYSAFYLGRLFNLALFITLVYFAVRILPFGKNILRVVALLPMTLHLAASYSYDSGIIGLAFLLTAFCVKAIYDKGAIKRKTCIAIGVLTFLLAPCKVVYLMISVAVFLIPSERFSSKRNALLFKFAIIAIAVLAIGISKASTLLLIASSDADYSVFVRGDEQGYVYTVNDILNSPFKFIAVLIRTVFTMGDFYLSTLVGGSLGYFQVEIVAPSYFVFALLLILIVSALPTPDDSSAAKPAHRIFFLIIAIMGCFGILLSMYLGWTFNTSPIIEGVQGRYFLPLLPLIMLAIRNNTFICKRSLSWSLIFALLLINSLYMTRVLSIALVL